MKISILIESCYVWAAGYVSAAGTPCINGIDITIILIQFLNFGLSSYYCIDSVAPEKYTAIYTVGGWMIALDKVNIINTLLAHK